MQTPEEFAESSWISDDARMEVAKAIRARDAEWQAQVDGLKSTIDAQNSMLSAYNDEFTKQGHRLLLAQAQVEGNNAELARLRAERNELLDEAAERGATWWIEQTSHIDPALAATNSGKWLIKLREKQTATLRAAIIGEEEKNQEHFKCGRKVARRLDWARFKERYMGGEG